MLQGASQCRRCLSAGHASRSDRLCRVAASLGSTSETTRLNAALRDQGATLAPALTDASHRPSRSSSSRYTGQFGRCGAEPPTSSSGRPLRRDALVAAALDCRRQPQRVAAGELPPFTPRILLPRRRTVRRKLLRGVLAGKRYVSMVGDRTGQPGPNLAPLSMTYQR